MNPDVKTIKQLLKELTQQIREQKRIRKTCARMFSKYWNEVNAKLREPPKHWNDPYKELTAYRDEATAKHVHSHASMKFTAFCMLRSAMRGRIHWAALHKTQEDQIASIASTLAYDAKNRVYPNWKPIFSAEELELIQRVMCSIDDKKKAVVTETATAA